MIGVSVEAENQCKDVRQEDQSQRKADAVAEGLGQLIAVHNMNDDVYHRDQHQQEEPAGAERDLEAGVDVVERNQRFPAGLSGLLKNLPVGNNQQNDHDPAEDGGCSR